MARTNTGTSVEVDWSSNVRRTKEVNCTKISHIDSLVPKM